MKQYSVNTHVLRASWIYLILWVMSGSAIIILLAMGSQYWFFPILGFVFFFLWLMLTTLYPKTVVISEESIAISMMGSDKVKIIRFTDLKVNDMNAYYELAVDRKGTQRKYLLTKKSLPHELERFLKCLIEQL